MMLIILAGLCILSVPLRGGRLTRLAELQLNWLWTAPLAVTLQVVIVTIAPTGAPTLHRIVHVLTYLLIAVFLCANLHIPGTRLVALGSILNVIAILANRGVMPMWKWAMHTAHMTPHNGFNNSGPFAHPHLLWLGDILPLPLPSPFHNVLSIGDLIIYAGMLVLLHRTCGPKRRAANRPQPATELLHITRARVCTRNRWGNCWVVVVLVVSLPCLGGRPVALPVLLRLFRPKDDKHPDRRSQPELARELIDMILKRFPGRIVELVMDGAYASRAWRELPNRVTVSTRMRGNARVYALPPVRQPGQKGRPPLKGAKLPTLAQIAAGATFAPATVTGPDGRQRSVHVHELRCLWYTPFYTRTVKVILVRNAGTTNGFDVAIASTDAEVPAEKLLSRYDSRWTIETCNQEAKAHGVGQARNRVQNAVQRTVPFGFLARTITIC